MGKWLLAVSVAFIGATLIVNDADARRLGGARSLGTQRNVAAPPAKPAQQAAPAGQQQNAQGGAAGQTAPAASGASRWLPMLGGLALGGLLGYLFAGNGLLGILLLALLAVGAVLAVRALMQRRSQEAPRPVQYAGMGQETVAAPPPSQPAEVQPGTTRGGAALSRIPAGFDAAGFVRAAKLNFIKLQVANDLGQIDDIREFTTGELFEDLRRDIAERATAAQQTDVVALDGELLEVATEGDKHWASVRFSGLVRETPGSEPVGFQEVWNLVKPADGSTGWLLAGIQQMH